MTKAHEGFAAGGVQKHSAGDDFPITNYSVGGYPRPGNGCYWVVSHPAGTKRWTWSASSRDRIIEAFKEADALTDGINFSTVRERTAFEISLLGIESRDKKEYGWDLDKNGKGGCK